jgi:truncated hemoglobin YjbI
MTTVAEQQHAGAAMDALSLPLFDHIGGIRSIEWLVDRFVDAIRSEPELAPSLARVDLASFKKSLAAFFTEALGGHYPDASVDSRGAHVHFEGEQLVRVALLLHNTLSSFGLSSQLHERLVLAVLSRALASGQNDAR